MGSFRSRQLLSRGAHAARATLVFGAFFFFPFWSSEISADDLRLPNEQIKAGRTIFLKKCAQCHGKDALGGSAPDIQGMILKDVEDSTRGVEAMPDIALSEVEAEHIAVFLMSLAPDQARLRLGIK